ncbi:patatin-like phospholipase family protein [Massilia sp. CCM 9210]|uniref:patatin-like phospholipase family protein n=1 Tax=Massilia scottii TaxID=3057166 RepID=UPI002796DA0D|nr:patatin-like phospholipase family protein [Massilia sp. CCM 9210]MDQ1816206.1 patatin-like phospholipase family protein [Massilia sp. CCM 9210]
MRAFSASVLLFLAVFHSSVLAADPPQRPKIGLVLSGGGARGVAHIGVLKVLEEMRIPVDYVVGTSMGSIVAGAYAMGNRPDDLEKRIAGVEWNKVLTDSPPRLERSTYAKATERKNIVSGEIGFSDAEMRLPRGLNYGQQIEFFFHTLAANTGDVAHFDELDIPFRAVATDIENGKMVVLERGGIARAMRASMSVPGVFAPVEIDDRALLDGGLVRNLPVDVVRAMGADIVIAVNLGTPLLKRDQIVSAFGVGQQMLNILTEQNVETSLRELTPRDVLILPQLGDFSAADFENSAKTIDMGAAAARVAAERLAPLALSEADFQAHLAARAARHPAVVKVNSVRIDTRQLKHVSERFINRKFSIKPGQQFSTAELHANMNSLYSTGDFENVTHRFEHGPDGRTLVIEPVEKQWGPNYLQAGVRLSTDLAGDSDFTILLAHRGKWLTRSGLEWRNTVSLGQFNSFTSQLYQPLGGESRWYIAPTVRFSQNKDNLIINDKAVATYSAKHASVGIDLVNHVDDDSTFKVGLERGTERSDPSIGVSQLTSERNQIGVIKLEYVQDRLDDWVFPSSGNFTFVNARIAPTSVRSTLAYKRLDMGHERAWNSGAHRFSVAGRAGKLWGDDLPLMELFSLGGFLNLSGYQARQFLGGDYLFGRGVYTLKTSLLGTRNVYLGASVEIGKMTRRLNGDPMERVQFANSLFGAVNTALGPFTVAVGIGERGNQTFYLFFGKP